MQFRAVLENAGVTSEHAIRIVGRLRIYTARTAFLEALDEAGVTTVFANLGSNHPALIEADAETRANGRRMPELLTCPNEMVALSAANGHAQ